MQLIKLVADSGANVRASFSDADVIECEYNEFEDDDDEDANGDEDDADTFTVRVPLLVRSLLFEFHQFFSFAVQHTGCSEQSAICSRRAQH